jgi:hypothetical protein
MKIKWSNIVTFIIFFIIIDTIQRYSLLGKNTTYIMIIILIVLVMFQIISIILNKGFNYVTIPKINIKDKEIKSKVDILPKNLFSTNTMRPSIFKVHVEFMTTLKEEDSGVVNLFSIKKICSIKEVKDSILRGKTEFRYGKFVNDFEILCFPHELLNFEFERDVFVNAFTVDEKYIA